ncbi:MAG: radical SAM protein [Ktedonobacteraceae bacterium]|nr:radical SAM protein [Ktedonobacteraceae bacterium]
MTQHTEITCLHEQHSTDGSIKFLWQLADGKTVESIYFTFREQYYTCISSQVGCNVGCPFCETGKQRVLRNLTAQELYAQVALIDGCVRAAGGPAMLDHVALAGMGEPLLNVAAVVAAATQLRADGLTETVSLSTSGVVPRIYDLAQTTETSVNKLFLSLHATTDKVRNHLVPLNKKYPLASVLEAATHFFARSGEKVTATYLLFADLNDTQADLARLLRLLDPAIYIVQFSEWNQVADCAFQPSPRLEYFQDQLQQAGYEVFIQRSKGGDIDGGCGQLRSRTLPVIPAAARPTAISTMRARDEEH